MIQVDENNCILKILNIRDNQVSTDFLNWLETSFLHTYEDRGYPQENMYDLEKVRIKMGIIEEELWEEEVNQIEELMNNRDCSYWRIIKI